MRKDLGPKLVVVIASIFAVANVLADATDGCGKEVLSFESALEMNSWKPALRAEELCAELERRGITFHLTYTDEAFHSIRLYADGDTSYRRLIELSIYLDTGKLGLWRNGQIFLIGQSGYGEGFNITPAGIVFPINDIDARDFSQISQYGLTQYFMDRKLKLY